MNTKPIARTIDALGGPGYLVGSGISPADAIALAQAHQTKRVADALERLVALAEKSESYPI